MTTFVFHTDPGHGWLEVSMHEMKAVNLNPYDFSHYSYRQHNVFYLEEDCDAQKFVDAYKKKHGHSPIITEKYAERTFIRSLPPIS
ncbi:hypothetical protein [Bradyrhizobium erythrophlei]|uniref:Uncharacterized protein n=1 Tax=Bradyrhizobium erythrophlei TaxID=1437360 RepID=A0A1M5T944_9BRAD|nr:hypothetical protein [Bradyrhizobium erythrophlei]SHH47287.1 hypothetical protein SAMN05444169_7626 [Bradyrhizobium erythrophlei]